MATDYTVGSTGLLSGCTHKDDVWSPNYYTGAKPNTGICVHHMASTNFDAAGARFARSSEQASTHYGVGPGYYTQYVSEKDGSWGCGCDWGNYRLIQIETVNSSGSPNWLVADKTYDTLARLMADIALRHGWKKLTYGTNVWGHRDMAAHGAASTACPGPYLYPRLAKLCEKANSYINSAGVWTRGKSSGHTSDWWYKHADGTYPKSCWKEIDGKWYLFDDEGWAVHSKWVQDSKGWCYLKPNPSCAAAKSECLEISGKWYAFGSDSRMKTSIDLNSNGSMKL